MDLQFLYNRYINHIKLDDGYRWDFPKHGMLIAHGEDFLNDIILNDGECFVDVGANVGAWSIRASPYYQMVEAYEPNPEVFAALKRNTLLNNCRNVFCTKLALDNVQGETEQSVLAPETPDRPMRKDRVNTRRLDDLGFQDLTLLKIDAEGAGFRVIQGGLQTILKYHPTIIGEVHSKQESQIPDLLPSYRWTKRFRDMPHTGDWLYREQGKQVFLIGTP